MPGKTHGMFLLISDALATISTPYSTDVILEVALLIDKTPAFLARYHHEAATLGVNTANSSLGRYVKRLTGMSSIKQVAAGTKTIIGSYTKLK